MKNNINNLHYLARTNTDVKSVVVRNVQSFHVGRSVQWASRKITKDVISANVLVCATTSDVFFTFFPSNTIKIV